MKLKLICTIACAATLSACSIVYHPPIQQGNVITRTLVKQLKPGMTQEEVRDLLGTPLMVGAMQDQRWDYIEYKLSGRWVRSTSIKKLKLLFLEGKLEEIQMSPNV